MLGYMDHNRMASIYNQLRWQRWKTNKFGNGKMGMVLHRMKTWVQDWLQLQNQMDRVLTCWKSANWILILRVPLVLFYQSQKNIDGTGVQPFITQRRNNQSGDAFFNIGVRTSCTHPIITIVNIPSLLLLSSSTSPIIFSYLLWRLCFVLYCCSK